MRRSPTRSTSTFTDRGWRAGPVRALLVLVGLALAICLGVGSGADAGAGDAALDDRDRLLIRETIRSQLDAFRRDDAIGAFAHASPAIQSRFGSPDAFMAMVRANYAPVYRPREVTFADLVVIRDRPTQRVVLIGPDGMSYLAHYPMVRQDDASWRIGGCALSRLKDQGA